jgi:hypothetical protein
MRRQQVDLISLIFLKVAEDSHKEDMYLLTIWI